MSGQGYIVPQQLLRLAIEKASDDQAQRLEACLELLTEVDQLERTFPARLEEARAKAGIESPRLSKAATEAVAESSTAAREIDRLLHRRCNRATTAGEIVRELLAVAREDMKSAAFLAREAPDEPSREILEELYDKKRDVVERLKGFVATNP